jgi:anaerobic selenocysteine-containing dehydrogenase
MRARCDEEHGLDFFQRHGWAPAQAKREVRHRYPRIFHKGRIPLYLEHWLTAGESVRGVVAETGIEWGDISGYEPLVKYRPCWASQEGGKEFPLYLVNYKVGFLNFSHAVRNPQLQELAWATQEIFNVGVHPDVANALGIETGETIEIEAASGRKVISVVRLTRDVHPRAVSVPAILGEQLSHKKGDRIPGLHFNSFLPYRLERVDMLSAALDSCVKIRITKVGQQ